MINNIELYVLKSLLNKQVFTDYQHVSDTLFSNPKSEFSRIYEVLKREHLGSTDSNSQLSSRYLENCFYSALPGLREKDGASYSLIFNRLRDLPDFVEGVEKLLLSLDRKERARKIGVQLLDSPETVSQEDLATLSSLLTQNTIQGLEPQGFVTDSLTELYEKTYKETGLRWRLQCLNKSLGSLRKGDFGFIFARPECGKTTFLASEISHMALQRESGAILWINNEEQGEKVMLRVIQAALGKSLLEIEKQLPVYERAYDSLGGMGIRLYDSATASRRELEKLFDSVQPSLIVFDQLDKIKGFSDERNDIELGDKYQWGREIAKQFAPVIGVCQSSASGENKRWLTMDDVSNAKTSKQAEADWIIGIGAVDDAGFESVRFLNISKNKLLGDGDTDPKYRHAKFEVLIKPEIARYEDIVKW